MAYFNGNIHFLRKIRLFTSLKEEECHFILPSQYKYDFLDGYPRGSLILHIQNNQKIEYRDFFPVDL